MAKKYCCPCCGEESISLINKIFHFASRGGSMGSFWRSGCPRCGEKFVPVTRYPGVFDVGYQVLLYLLGVLSFLGIIMNTTLFLWLFLSYCLSLVFIIFPLHNYLFCALAPMEPKIYSERIFEANAIVELHAASKKTENLDIYRARFEPVTRNKRFVELFADGLVPIVIHKMNRRQKSPFHVRFMKAEFLPVELLHNGVRFTVVSNGVDIATGTVIKLLEDSKKDNASQRRTLL